MPTLHDGRYTVPEKWETSAMGDFCFGTDNSNGQKVFIKKFNMYKYAADAEGFPNLEKQNERTEHYRQRMEKINQQVGQIARNGGDVVVTLDFFRDDINLYKVTQYVDILPWKPEEVHNHLTVTQIDSLMLRSVYALSALHKAGLLHCDLKPDNIFIVKQDDTYVGMVSDFDDSFFMNDVPCGADVVGTPEYMSPELGLYKFFEQEQPDSDCPLTPSSDIFAMGLIYHMYLTGEMPQFDTSKFDQFWALFWSEEDSTFSLSPKLDAAHYELLSRIFVGSHQYRTINTGSALAEAIKEIQQYRNREYKLTIKNEGKPAANQSFGLYGTYNLGSGDDAIECCEEMTTFKTDANGVAVLKGLLPESKYSMKFSKKQMPIVWKGSGNVKECVIDFQPLQSFDVTLRCDGEPQKNAKLSLKQKGKPDQEKITDSQGRARFHRPENDFIITYQGIKRVVQKDTKSQFIFDLYTLNLKVGCMDAPVVGKQIEVFQILPGGKTEKVGAGKTDSKGIFSLVLGETGGKWQATCESAITQFSWNGEKLVSIEFIFGTEVAFRTVLCGSTTPLKNVKVAFCQKLENGKARVLKSAYTDVKGCAELGRFAPGQYAVAVMEIPKGYKFRGKVKHPYDATLGEKRKRFKLEFLREFVLEHPEGIVADQKVPKSVSKQYERVIHYKDGVVVLVLRNGNQQKVTDGMLGLYGLETFKRS